MTACHRRPDARTWNAPSGTIWHRHPRAGGDFEPHVQDTLSLLRLQLRLGSALLGVAL